MNMKVHLRPQAKKDLIDLLEYIKSNNKAAVKRLQNAINETLALVLENPLIASELNNLDESYSEIRCIQIKGFNNYNIYYRPIEASDNIEIIRLGFGGRDWGNLL